MILSPVQRKVLAALIRGEEPKISARTRAALERQNLLSSDGPTGDGAEAALENEVITCDEMITYLTRRNQ